MTARQANAGGTDERDRCQVLRQTQDCRPQLAEQQKSAQLQEIQQLLGELKEPYKSMVLIAACLGLRVSEIMGLKWGDIDWQNPTILAQRSVVHGQVGETKTEYSCRPVPLDPDLSDHLLDLRHRSFYQTDADWIFAGDSGKPRW